MEASRCSEGFGQSDKVGPPDALAVPKPEALRPCKNSLENKFVLTFPGFSVFSKPPVVQEREGEWLVILDS
jgi:hypothetical protein